MSWVLSNEKEPIESHRLQSKHFDFSAKKTDDQLTDEDAIHNVRCPSAEGIPHAFDIMSDSQLKLNLCASRAFRRSGQHLVNANVHIPCRGRIKSVSVPHIWRCFCGQRSQRAEGTHTAGTDADELWMHGNVIIYQSQWMVPQKQQSDGLLFFQLNAEIRRQRTGTIEREEWERGRWGRHIELYDSSEQALICLVCAACSQSRLYSGDCAIVSSHSDAIK